MSTAILLINLGTPQAPTPAALRRYLGEFLQDQRVVEIPRLLWWPVLYGVILNTRPGKSAAKYASIWTDRGSPLKAHTENQAALLQQLLQQRGHGDWRVDWAMRYGEPSVAARLDQLCADGAERILIAPLYPQYAASTTASCVDAVAAWTRKRRNLPELAFVRDCHEHPGYISALAASVREHWRSHGPLADNDRLLLSFHGLPQRCVNKGDPYQAECLRSAELLRQDLGLDEQQFLVSFQSRFGPEQWLQPYTEPTLVKLASKGVRRVDVMCPGFVADCLETLEEIAIECKSSFLAAGGETFHYLPCLNESPAWVATLADLAMARLAPR